MELYNTLREAIAKPRYVIRELEGFPIHPSGHTSGSSRTGLTVTVLDRLYNYRVIADFKTEDKRFGNIKHERRCELIRQQASELADRLQRTWNKKLQE